MTPEFNIDYLNRRLEIRFGGLQFYAEISDSMSIVVLDELLDQLKFGQRNYLDEDDLNEAESSLRGALAQIEDASYALEDARDVITSIKSIIYK